MVYEFAKSIEEAFRLYFANLFSSSKLSSIDVVTCIEGIQPKFPAKMNTSFLKTFRREEVEKAFHQMAPFKSLGPDGFGIVFIKNIER